jgi:hypothetical protein
MASELEKDKTSLKPNNSKIAVVMQLSTIVFGVPDPCRTMD